MRFRFSRRAEKDIREIGDFIAHDNPERAASFVADLRSRCRDIVAFPLSAPVRPATGDGIRVIPFGAYLIFYVVYDDLAEIRRVVHGARDLPSGVL